MRKIWVKVDPWDKKLVTTAIEGGVPGLRAAMTSAFPVSAPIATPPPSDFASVIRSGSIPKCW